MTTGNAMRLLRQHWLFIVLSALLGAALGLGYAALQAPEFTAKADVVITVTSGENTGELAQGSSFSQQQARNYAAIATREIVLGPVIEDLGLDESVAQLRKQISTSVPLNTSLVTIQATDTDPELAATIANSAATHLAKTVASLSPKVSDVAGSPVKAQLIESASTPTRPSSPNIALFTLFGLLVGLVLGIACQVVVELAVARVRSADQLRDLFGLTVLGSIARDRTTPDSPVAVVGAPQSLRAEQVRQVRTALKFLPGGGQRTFVITSSISGEGKSTTAANIAAAFAAEGTATCLVEADLRRPVLVDTLDLTGGAGLSDVIVGECELADALQPWGPNGLQVLIAGSIPPNPSELLGSERGGQTLAELRRRFDVVIIDSPPLTSVTDATLLGRLFGGVILVVGAHHVRATDVRHSLSALDVADVPLLGAVANMVRDDQPPNAYAYVHAAPQRASRVRSLLSLATQPRVRTASKAVLAAILAAGIGLGMFFLNTQFSKAAPTSSGALAPASIEIEPEAVFIGDALVQGVGGDGTTWPDLASAKLGWEPINLGLGGTGYVTNSGKSDCGLDQCPTFVDVADKAIDANPNIVLIAGGESDGHKDVDAASAALFKKLRGALPAARIVVLSPVPAGPTRAYPEQLQAMGKVLAKNAAAAGVEYLDIGNPLGNKKELFLKDGTHPNADGYQSLSATIVKALTS